MTTGKLRFKHVNKIRDRHGNVRNYFRPPGGEAQRLPDDFGSRDFIIEHTRLLREFEDGRGLVERVGSPKAPEVQSKANVGFLPGSVGAFIEEWRHSDEFKSKAPMSQYNYNKALDYLRDRNGSARLDEVTVEDIDEYTRTIKSASAADLQVQMLSMLWEFARGSKDFKPRQRINPTTEARKRYKRADEDGHKEWPEDLQRKFLAAAKPPVKLLFYLLRETGQRLGDVCNMKWSHFDPETRTILIARTEKTRNPVFVRVTDRLLEVLSTTPRHGDHILSKVNGVPFRKGTLSHRIGRTLTAIGYGRRGTAEETYSAHGLRKTLASEMAMNGVSVPAMQAQLGQKTPKMALYYAQQAEKRLLAAQAGQAIDAGRRRKRVVEQDDVIDFVALRKQA